MNERPILFNGEMVKAILDGSKTMTRRVVKPQPEFIGNLWRWKNTAWSKGNAQVSDLFPLDISQYQPGDRLWVRETWATQHKYDAESPREIPEEYANLHYMATEDKGGLLVRPSIFMPRWASRITLEITDVKVERVQEISEEDADSEGFGGDFPSIIFPEIFPGSIDYYSQFSIPRCFGMLWDSLNAKRGYSWESNPWVWAITFTRLP